MHVSIRPEDMSTALLQVTRASTLAAPIARLAAEHPASVLACGILDGATLEGVLP